MKGPKFRVWEEREKEYDTWSYYLDSSGVLFRNVYGNFISTDNQYILELSTGLKDKNGKEIYEGDIVKLTGKVAKNKSTLYKVVWDNFLAGFDLINLEHSKADIGYLNEAEMEKRYEVIGNIHENPELLEKEEE